MPLRS
jgi:hypothetical protein